MLPRYRRIIWVVAWLITKTLLLASFQKHFHVSISVFWCVFWRVTNAKHSSAWQNTNTTISFSPSWEHFTSYSVRKNTVRNQEEKWMCWTRTNVLLMENNFSPHWTKGYSRLSVEEPCCVAIRAAAQSGPTSRDQKAKGKCDVRRPTKEKRKKNLKHIKRELYNEPVSLYQLHLTTVNTWPTLEKQTPARLYSHNALAMYPVEQHVLCLEMERKSKSKNKTFLDYNIEMEKQVTKLVLLSFFFLWI